MNCRSQYCNDDVKQVFFTRPVFEVPTFEVVTSVILDFGGHRYEEIKSLWSQMNCQPQDCNDDVKQVFFTRPVFEVPTFEVVTSVILDFGGHRYEEIKSLWSQMSCQPQDCNDDVKQVFFTRPVFEVPTFEVVTSVILDFGGHRYEEIKSLWSQMSCQPQDCNDNVKQVLSTSPVFEVPTFEVVTSGILDFEGHKYEKVE